MRGTVTSPALLPSQKFRKLPQVTPSWRTAQTWPGFASLQRWIPLGMTLHPKRQHFRCALNHHCHALHAVPCEYKEACCLHKVKKRKKWNEKKRKEKKRKEKKRKEKKRQEKTTPFGANLIWEWEATCYTRLPRSHRWMSVIGAFQWCLSWFGNSWLLSLSSTVGGCQRNDRKKKQSQKPCRLSVVPSNKPWHAERGLTAELWSLSVPCWVCIWCQLCPDATSELIAAGHESLGTSRVGFLIAELPWLLQGPVWSSLIFCYFSFIICHCGQCQPCIKCSIRTGHVTWMTTVYELCMHAVATLVIVIHTRGQMKTKYYKRTWLLTVWSQAQTTNNGTLGSFLNSMRINLWV